MSDLPITDVWSYRSKSRSIFRFIRYQQVGIIAAAFEFALIFAVGVAAGVVYHLVLFDFPGEIGTFVAVGGYSSLIFVLLSKVQGVYEPGALLSARAQIRGALVAWVTVLLFATCVLFVLKSGANYSRGAMISFGLIGCGLILSSRTLVSQSFQRALANGTLAGRRAIIIGDTEELAANSSPQLLRTYGARDVGRFELADSADHSGTEWAQDIAVVDAAVSAALAKNADQVLLALRWVDAKRRDLICDRLRVLPLPVVLIPDRFVSSVFSLGSHKFSDLTAVEIQRAPLSVQDLILKRVLDVTLATFAMVVLSPLFLITCLFIKLDSKGPVIFRQRRSGFNGREFTIYKFRTMKVLEDGPGMRQACRGDARITRFGRALRSSSIDELPQLWNVFAGDMSLVGPRPHAVAHDCEYGDAIDNYVFRHHVKPGITGWAQANGFRGETADIALMKRRIELDLWYVNNWSVWLDLRILARTCRELVRPRNAY